MIVTWAIGLIIAGMILFSSIQHLSSVPPFLKSLFATFLILTGIGLLERQNWARVSLILLSGVVAGIGSLLSAVLVEYWGGLSLVHRLLTLPFAQIVVVSTLIFFPVLAIVYFLQEDVKRLFFPPGDGNGFLRANGLSFDALSQQAKARGDNNAYWQRKCDAFFYQDGSGRTILSMGVLRPAYVVGSRDVQMRLRDKLILYHKWMSWLAIVILCLLVVPASYRWEYFIGGIVLVRLLHHISWKMLLGPELTGLSPVARSGVWREVVQWVRRENPPDRIRQRSLVYLSLAIMGACTMLFDAKPVSDPSVPIGHILLVSIAFFFIRAAIYGLAWLGGGRQESCSIKE